MIRVFMMFIEDRIFKAHISYTWRILSFVFGILDAIRNISYRKHFELHYVLSESSSFVTEDIVNHSKFFIEIWWLNRTRNTFVLIKHHPVFLHKVSLEELNHFERHHHWDSHEVHKSQEPSSETDWNRNPKLCSFRQFKILILVSIYNNLLPCCTVNSCNEAKKTLYEDCYNNVAVCAFLNWWLLCLCTSAVFHYFCFVTCENSHAINILSVS